MKKTFNAIIDWFEEHFNTIIDMVALIGASFMILLSIVVFIFTLADSDSILNAFEVIVLPGAIGFFAILMLFALRITRHITKK